MCVCMSCASHVICTWQASFGSFNESLCANVQFHSRNLMSIVEEEGRRGGDHFGSLSSEEGILFYFVTTWEYGTTLYTTCVCVFM